MVKHIHATQEKQFWLHDGRKLLTLHQLQEALSDMNDATFRHHVDRNHNDFAAWSLDIFGDKKLADSIRKAGSRKSMINAIDNALKNAEMDKITDAHHLREIANRIRQDLIKMLLNAGSGHSAGPLGMADIFTAFYFNLLNHKPRDPQWEERDRLFLSNGHIVPIRYTTMAHAGYFPISELMTLRKLHTRLQGHPERMRLPGVESTSGPLGSGLAQAAGYAYAARMDRRKFNVYCIASDGEHDSGNHWEAVLFAGKNKLQNLTLVIDRNNIQIDGYTENIMPLEPLADKYRAFNWHVIEIDGHNMRQIIDSVNEAKAIYEKPTAIIAHVIPGKGISFMENLPEWHGKPPNAQEAKRALHELRTLGGKIKSEHE